MSSPPAASLQESGPETDSPGHDGLQSPQPGGRACRGDLGGRHRAGRWAALACAPSNAPRPGPRRPRSVAVPDHVHGPRRRTTSPPVPLDEYVLGAGARRSHAGRRDRRDRRAHLRSAGHRRAHLRRVAARPAPAPKASTSATRRTASCTIRRASRRRASPTRRAPRSRAPGAACSCTAATWLKRCFMPTAGARRRPPTPSGADQRARICARSSTTCRRKRIAPGSCRPRPSQLRARAQRRPAHGRRPHAGRDRDSLARRQRPRRRPRRARRALVHGPRRRAALGDQPEAGRRGRPEHPLHPHPHRATATPSTAPVSATGSASASAARSPGPGRASRWTDLRTYFPGRR